MYSLLETYTLLVEKARISISTRSTIQQSILSIDGVTNDLLIIIVNANGKKNRWRKAGVS